MEQIKNIIRTAAMLAAMAMPAMSWAQVNAVVVPTEVTSVKDGSADATITAGTGANEGTNRAEATQGNTVTITTAGPRVNPETGRVQIPKVTVRKITSIKAEGITVTAAGNATEMNGNATLQMTANFSPTYTDNKAVQWSVASASGSSATATIDENGLLTAGTTQGDVVVTAATQDGSNLQATKTITITTIPLTADMITIAATSYTGSARTPTVTVNDGTRNLVQGTDFTLGSWSNNVNVGTNTASVTVTGMGAYTGSIVKTFSIAKGNQSPSINDRKFYAGGMSCTLSGSYNTSGQFQLQVYYNNEWNNVETVTQTNQGKFEVYTDDGYGYQYRLKISGNGNWNDYTSGNL